MKAVLVLLLLLLAFTGLGNDLEALIESYEREKARVLAPVELKYEKALSELLQRYTKAGRLEDANKVAQIIELRKTTDGDWLRLKDTKWKWESGGILTLQKNRRALHTKWRSLGKWKRIDDHTLELQSDVGTRFAVKFSTKKEAAVMMDGGGTTRITLVEE